MDLALVGTAIGALFALIGAVAAMVQVMDYIERRRAFPAAPAPRHAPSTSPESLDPLPADEELKRRLSKRAKARAEGVKEENLPALSEIRPQPAEDPTPSRDAAIAEEIEEYLQALEYPESQTPGIWCSLGAAYDSIGQVEDAIHAYSNALALNPNYGESRYFRAMLYFKLDELDKAMSDLKELVNIPEYQKVAHFWLATIHGKRRRTWMNQIISTFVRSITQG